MKNLILLLFLVFTFTFNSFAQITLTADDFPQVGESIVSVEGVATSTLSVGNSGANQTYDFSAIVPSDTSAVTFIAASGTIGFSEYPNATHAIDTDGDFVYFQQTSDAVFQLGGYVDTSQNNSGQYAAFPFDPTSKILEIPSTFGTNFMDMWALTITIPIDSPFADSIRSTTAEDRDVLFDGYGTVITPDGSFDGLRERIFGTTTVTTEALSFGIWSVIDVQTFMDTSYNWYANNSNGPLVSATIVNDEIATISYTTLSNVVVAPNANFTFAGQGGGVVNFTDQSSNTPTSWLWDFGDGNTSTQENPQHTFASAGPYNVCLTVTNDGGSDMICQTVTISFAPVAAFTVTFQGIGTFDFMDQSTNNPTSWLWDFGDGNTSADQNPQHTYSQPGTYTVCLTVTNNSGSDMTCANVEVIFAPVAAFTSADLGGGVFDFTDQSTNNPTSWEWDFGDGNTSNQQNPQHIYNQPGTYTVCLMVTNDVGSDITCSTIEVIIPPIPDYTFTDQGIGVIDFTDQSANEPTSWLWDFGDGTTSTDQNPQHTYTENGTYNVCLTVTNAAGSDMICQMITVVVLSIGDLSSVVNIQLFPNPVEDILSLQLVSDEHQILYFRLFNALGQNVLEKQVNSNGSYHLNVEQLATGMYYFQLINLEGTKQLGRKILKQ